jgi:hypothetical protein
VSERCFAECLLNLAEEQLPTYSIMPVDNASRYLGANAKHDTLWKSVLQGKTLTMSHISLLSHIQQSVYENVLENMEGLNRVNN